MSDNINSLEIGMQVIDGIECCGKPMHSDDNLFDCVTCRSTVDLGSGRYVEEIVVR